LLRAVDVPEVPREVVHPAHLLDGHADHPQGETMTTRKIMIYSLSFALGWWGADYIPFKPVITRACVFILNPGDVEAYQRR
jgi:hypothetical protein